MHREDGPSDLSAEEGASGEERFDGSPLDALEIGDFVPPALAPWRPLVVEALSYFLERLPPPRLAAIVEDQFALDEDAAAAVRLVALLSRCPTLHKLGQVLARHPRLDPVLRRELQSLESMPSMTPFAPIRARIREELGDAAAITVADAALAQGSVAVVVPFTYCDDGRTLDGVLKVLKPGVEALLAEELAVLPEVAEFLERRSRELDLPALDYREHLATVQRLLTKEVLLEVEQEHMRRAARAYADEPRVWIPRVLRWSTPRMTAMERVFGTKVPDAPLAPTRRREVAETLISALLAQPFWTASDEALFHGDLHGGNLIVAADGRVAVIDWSLAGSLAKGAREALVAIALGGLMLDAPRIRRAIGSLARGVAPDDPVLVEVVERALDRLVLRRTLPGFDWLLAMLDEFAMRSAAGFPEDFALFRKSWLSLNGVIGDLAGEVSPDLPLLALGLQRFVAEFPARLVARPASLAFATHVSNADVVELSVSSWASSWRYWARLFAAWARLASPSPRPDCAGETG